MTAAAAAHPPLLHPRSLGEALTLLRHRAGLGRDEAAEAAHVGGGTLSRYENDLTDKPDMAAIRRVVAMLTGYTGDDMAEVWNEIGTLLDRRERVGFSEAGASVHHLRERESDQRRRPRKPSGKG